MAKGINAKGIVVLDPTVTLQSLRIYCACQVETPSLSSENWFEEFLECMDVTQAELDTLLTESEKDNLMYGPIDCIVQAINSIHFDEPQCPISRVGNLRPAGRIRPAMRNRPARDISISYYKNTARRFLLSLKLQCWHCLKKLWYCYDLNWCEGGRLVRRTRLFLRHKTGAKAVD